MGPSSCVALPATSIHTLPSLKVASTQCLILLPRYPLMQHYKLLRSLCASQQQVWCCFPAVCSSKVVTLQRTCLAM